MKKQKDLFRVIRRKYKKERTKYKLVESEVVLSTTSYKKAQRKFFKETIIGYNKNKELHIIAVEIFDDTISNFRPFSYEEYVRYENV